MPSTTNRRPLRRLLMVPVLGVAVLSSVAFSGIGTAYAAASPQTATAPAQSSGDKPATDNSSSDSSSSSSAPSNPLDIVLNLVKPVLGLVTSLPTQITGALTPPSDSTSTTQSSDSSGTAKTAVAIPEGTQVIAACQEQSADASAYMVHVALPQAIAGLAQGASVAVDSSALTGLAGQAVPNVPMCASSESMTSNS